MSAVTFHIRPPSEQERKEAGFRLQKVIRPRRGGETVYVGHGAPAGRAGAGAKPRFALYRDLAGREPLGFVVRPVAGQSSGGRLAVLGPGGEALGELGTPAKRARWRPRHEIRLPDGPVFTGHGGTATSWVVFVVLSPLWLVVNLLWAAGGSGDAAWSLPVRTAWRRRPGSPAPLKYHGMTGRYRVRTDRLDVRVGYAQAVVHSSGSAS